MRNQLNRPIYNLNEEIENQKINRYEHILRMDNNRLPKGTIKLQTGRTQRDRRAKTRWKDKFDWRQKRLASAILEAAEESLLCSKNMTHVQIMFIEPQSDTRCWSMVTAFTFKTLHVTDRVYLWLSFGYQNKVRNCPEDHTLTSF
jgi:hypothetical protein